MAECTYLLGCPTVDAACVDYLRLLQQAGRIERQPGWGPLLMAKRSFPLLWLGGFSTEDKIEFSLEYPNDTRSDADKELEGQRFFGLAAEKKLFQHRLEARRNCLLSLLPSDLATPYAKLFDEWVAFVEGQFSNIVFLNPAELLCMGPETADGAEVLDSLQAIAEFQAGRSVEIRKSAFELTWCGLDFENVYYDLDSIDAARTFRAGLVGFSASPGWPPEPSHIEIDFAEKVPRFGGDVSAVAPTSLSIKKKPWWRFWS